MTSGDELAKYAAGGLIVGGLALVLFGSAGVTTLGGVMFLIGTASALVIYAHRRRGRRST